MIYFLASSNANIIFLISSLQVILKAAVTPCLKFNGYCVQQIPVVSASDYIHLHLKAFGKNKHRPWCETKSRFSPRGRATMSGPLPGSVFAHIKTPQQRLKTQRSPIVTSYPLRSRIKYRRIIFGIQVEYDTAISHVTTNMACSGSDWTLAQVNTTHAGVVEKILFFCKCNLCSFSLLSPHQWVSNRKQSVCFQHGREQQHVYSPWSTGWWVWGTVNTTSVQHWGVHFNTVKMKPIWTMLIF